MCMVGHYCLNHNVCQCYIVHARLFKYSNCHRNIFINLVVTLHGREGERERERDRERVRVRVRERGAGEKGGGGSKSPNVNISHIQAIKGRKRETE